MDALLRQVQTLYAEEGNHHRALPPGLVLEDVLCLESTRVVQNDWTFTLDGRTFQIPPQPNAPRARRRVCLRQRLDQTILCLYQGRPVEIEEVA